MTYTRAIFPDVVGYFMHPHSTSVATSWFKRISGTLERRKTVRHLLSIDERTLSDIGMTRGALVAELGYDPKLTGAGIDAPGAQMPALQRRV